MILHPTNDWAFSSSSMQVIACASLPKPGNIHEDAQLDLVMVQVTCNGLFEGITMYIRRLQQTNWILFSAAACFFFDLQLFFSPAMSPRKRAHSFFQPLCIILRSLFLGPETCCSEPRIFFRTPRHLFLDLRCFFLTFARETHTQGEIKSKSQIRKDANEETKAKQGKIKGKKLHAIDNKNQKISGHITRRKPHEKRFRGSKAMKTNGV